MSWRIWAVAGEALNFGARRMETILRVAWLPVVLLMLLQMVVVFLGISVTLGRVTTLEEAGSYGVALQAYPQFALAAWRSEPVMMTIIAVSTFILSIILISSFMAPLIRYAATGEKPAPGLIRIPFGRDQLRFSVAAVITAILSFPILMAPMAIMFFVMRAYVFLSLLSTKIANHVKFPFENSLHTVANAQILDVVTDTGRIWLFGIPFSLITLIIPMAVIFAFMMIAHFTTRKRAPHLGSGRSTRWQRRTVISLISFGLIALFWGWVVNLIPRPPLLLNGLPAFPEQGRLYALFFVLLIFILGYVNLRAFAWPGFAVMDKSLSLSGSRETSRGWNLFKLIGLLIMVVIIMFGMQLIINILIGQILFPVILNIYGLLITTTRLVNSGVSAEWIFPVIQWTWNAVRLLLNLFWTFFSYGVLAGIYGRLYAHTKAARPYLPE